MYLRTFLICILLFGSGDSASAQSPLDELKKLSIEELAEADITGAARRPEKLEEVAAAVTVITSDDLRRYGVMNLPQALRLADTLHVASIGGPSWAISARGFNISTANKMLVMIDGRTIYSPVFAGVFWEAQDLVIADIDRIEIVRGPGGTLWGANAVNGVIHIITKSAADTRGTFVNAAAGSHSLGPIAVRHGGRFRSAGSYRVYAKLRANAAADLEGGGESNQHTFGQTGFRLESDRIGSSHVILQGDLFSGATDINDGLDRSIDWGGGHLTARWTNRAADGAETTLQAYYDYFQRRVPQQIDGRLHTVDVDGQHQRPVGRHSIVVGGGYRLYHGDDVADGDGFFFEPPSRTSHRSNVFAQAQFELSPEWFATAGSKLEHNEFTGIELQPSVAVRWTRGAQTAWSMVSRAVRVPTRFDVDLRVRIPGTSIVALTGTDDFESESVMALEAGYRRRLGNRLSIDAAIFNNRYDNLRSQEYPVEPGEPVRLMNMLNAGTRGVELTGKAQLLDSWQIAAAYTHLWKEFTLDRGSTDPTGGVFEANDPRHIFKVRSYANIGPRTEFDVFMRHFGALPEPAVAPYTQADMRLGYRVGPGWDLAVVGTNVLTAGEVEFRGGTPPQVSGRSVTLRSTWRF